MRTVRVVVLWLLLPAGAFAQMTPELSPGARYDPKIPTIKQVLGHDHGERITPPEDVARYLRALADAAPDRTRLTQYATSWQGRPLWLFVIGNRERMARVDALQREPAAPHRRLARDRPQRSTSWSRSSR